MSILAADFETTTKEDDCRVWAFAYCNIEEPDNCTVGNSLDDFISSISLRSHSVFFHNLKFDGSFIIDWLFRHGYEHVIPEKTARGKREKLRPGQMTTVISDMGIWYTLEVCWLDTGETTLFKDSAKLIPLSVEAIPKAFGLEEAKLTIDYKEDREIGHKLTDEEIAYVKEDVIIIAKAIRIMRERKQTKLTAAANALNDFKSRFDTKEFNRKFPKIDKLIDADIRMSYKGGWTYLNPKFIDKKVGAGAVYDVNSMYPWAMRDCLLPYGDPVYFYQEPYYNPTYPLFVIQFEAAFKLKPNHYPSIQLKNTMHFADNQYIEECDFPMLLTLTSVDYELLLENYDVDITRFHGGYYFMGKIGMFTEYIDEWYQVKSESKRTGNLGMAYIAKLMLNSLYGKFGMRLDGRSKIPYFDKEKNCVRYKLSEKEERQGVYLPVATFITSYCRDKIIRTANSVYNRFIYADTDSLHILGTEPAEAIDVDDYRLGAFKKESEFIRARFVRQKAYYEISPDEEMELKCAGMPKRMKDTVEEDDFYLGAVFDIGPDSKFAPKLTPKVVPGGVILRETAFKIH